MNRGRMANTAARAGGLSVLAVPARLASNNTRQGSTRKGTLKPAGFSFLGAAYVRPDGRGQRP